MKAKKRKVEVSLNELKRIAHDAVRGALYARQIRDLIRRRFPEAEDAAEAAQESLDWAVQAGELLADRIEEKFGRGSRPHVYGADIREALESILEDEHLEIGLYMREKRRPVK